VARRPSDYPPPVKVREFVAEPKAAQDERIDVGVLFVGGGPAGLAGAIRLGQLLAEDPATAEALGEVPIAVLDKGRVAGAHLLSGAVVNPSALRALLPEVLKVQAEKQQNLVDVRSPDEFSGKVIAPPGMTETAQRGGHIPGAKSIPWSMAANADGTFKSADELRKIYVGNGGIDPGKDTISYCRIGERSSHTWVVLKYLLGLSNVKNYDGSWTEYGSVVGAPIER